MSKKTLAICGGSYFTTDSHYPGQSFGEILATKHNLQLESLARSGCSNFTIALQIDKAIELNPEFIIVGCTDWARIELPIVHQGNLLKNFLNWAGWPSKSQEIAVYDKIKGLLNIKYSDSVHELSSQYSQPAEETIISFAAIPVQFTQPELKTDISSDAAKDLFENALSNIKIKNEQRT